MLSGLKVAGGYFQASKVGLPLSWVRIRMGRKSFQRQLKTTTGNIPVLIARSIIYMRSILNVIFSDVSFTNDASIRLTKLGIDTGVRPYACGLCNDTFSRSDILKRHFQKCSSRRGNPTGQSHLSLSRANKKAKEQQDAGLTGNGTPTVADHAHMANYPPTTMDASFDINTLTLNQHNYGGPSNQVSRSNSVTQPKRGTESQSNRASLGMMTTSSYESGNYATSTGHVTPDSITTSGAATPYTFHHELRPTQLPESGSFPQSSHADLSFPASSRPPTSSHYATTPHIVTQEYGREYSSDWQNYPPHNTHDEYGNEQHHSGTHTPLERDKPATDYTGVTLPNYQYLAHQRP